jgi:hypothetical protein
VEREIRTIDGMIPITQERTMEQVIYGLMACTVQQRMQGALPAYAMTRVLAGPVVWREGHRPGDIRKRRRDTDDGGSHRNQVPAARRLRRRRAVSLSLSFLFAGRSRLLKARRRKRLLHNGKSGYVE